MKNKNKRETYVFIMGHAFPRSELIKLVTIALLVFLMLAAGAGYFYFDWLEGQKKRAENVEDVLEFEEEAALAKAELNPLKSFFETYLKQTSFDQVDSIRAVGPYEVDDVKMELTFLAKRPGLYRQSLRLNDLLIEFGYDGEEVWFSQTHEVVDSADPDLMNLNKSLAILESAIPSLAWEYDPKVPITEFELMPDIVWEGDDCYVIKNTGLLEGIPVYHYIDKATGFEHYRRASVQIAPKRFKDVELFYDPPLADSKYPIPGGMELLLDGRLYYKVEFESVRVNPGLLNYLFEKSE